MKHSVGKSFATGTAHNLFTVPNGFIAVVYMVFITNTSGNTISYDMGWYHSHGPHTVRFAFGKSLGSGSSDQFTNGELIMKEGDALTITNTGAVDVIATFDLIKSLPLYAFEGE
jgi:hypothetical protein